MFVIGIWIGMASVGVGTYLAISLPPIDRVDTGTHHPSVTVAAADGATIARFGALDGDSVSVAILPNHMIEAVLAIEDRRFYRH
ncbi:MAG: carboxypeptidase, partial [Pseudomonadota bacterium]